MHVRRLVTDVHVELVLIYHILHNLNLQGSVFSPNFGLIAALQGGDICKSGDLVVYGLGVRLASCAWSFKVFFLV